MRAVLALGTIAVTAALAGPASAQMCGGGQAQAGASSDMCGGMMKAEAAAPGAASQQSEAKPAGCACCQNMAMMQPEDAMPGMDMPAEPAPTAPE